MNKDGTPYALCSKCKKPTPDTELAAALDTPMDGEWLCLRCMPSDGTRVLVTKIETETP